MDFSRLRDINQQNLEQADKQVEKTMQELATLRTQEVFVKAIQSLADLIANHTTRTIVENQIQGFATTKDTQALGVSLQALLAELKTHENTDVSPVVEVLKEAVAELKSIPKDHKDIEIPDQIDYTEKFNNLINEIKGVLKAVKEQETTVEAPVVNVEAPKVEVEAPDLKPLGKDLEKSFKTAVKAIVIPKPIDNTKELKQIVAEQKKTNKLLLEIPTSGGGGGGAIVDTSALATSAKQDDIVQAIQGISGTTNKTTRIETVGTRTYIGNAAIGSAESASVWQIKVLDTPGLTKLWADGNDNFDNVWDDRATVTYS